MDSRKVRKTFVSSKLAQVKGIFECTPKRVRKRTSKTISEKSYSIGNIGLKINKGKKCSL